MAFAGCGNSLHGPFPAPSASWSETWRKDCVPSPPTGRGPWLLQTGEAARVRPPLRRTVPSLVPRRCPSEGGNLKPLFMIMPSFPWTPANCTTKINGEPSRPVLKDGPSCGLRPVTRHPLAPEHRVLITPVSLGPAHATARWHFHRTSTDHFTTAQGIVNWTYSSAAGINKSL